MEKLVDLVIGSLYYIWHGSILVLFISLCLHHQAFYNMFGNSLRKFDLEDRHQSDKRVLCDIIRFHVVVKE